MVDRVQAMILLLGLNDVYERVSAMFLICFVSLLSEYPKVSCRASST